MNKHYKNILLGAGLCFCIGFPILLSSCASTSFHTRPFYLGFRSGGEYMPVWGDKTNCLDLAMDPNTTESDDNKTMDKYMPKGEGDIFMDENNYAAYAYCQPQKILDDTDSVVDSYWNWNLPLLQYTGTKNQNKILSYRNINLTAGMNSMANTAEILKSYYNLALTYLAQPGISLNPKTQNRDAWLNALFGGGGFSLADHPDDIADYYNLIFSKANVLAETGKPIEFGPSNVTFNFETSPFGYGPLLTNNIVTPDDVLIESITENMPAVNFLLSNRQLNDILSDPYYQDNGHLLQIGDGDTTTPIFNKIVSQGTEVSDSNTFHVGGISSFNNNGYASPYATYTTVSSDGDDNGKITNVFIRQVPIVITSTGVDFTFYNYKKSNTFNPTKWDYSLQDVQNAVNSSKSWKKYSKFVPDTSPTIPNNVCAIHQENEIYNRPIATSTYQTPDDPGVDYTLDPVTQSIFANLRDEVSPLRTGSYIGFANYACLVDTDSVSGDTHLYPYCTGITSLYPTFIFSTQDGAGNPVLDSSLLSFNKNADLVDEDGYGSEYKNYCTLDASKLDKKMNEIFNFFQKYVGADSKPSTDPQSVYDYQFIQYLFSNSMIKDYSGNTTPHDFIHWQQF